MTLNRSDRSPAGVWLRLSPLVRRPREELVGKQRHGSVFGFTGEIQNPVDSLVHFQARTYNPGIGRFVHEDGWPTNIEDPRTQHQYLYAFNNPTTYVDYLGYFGCCGVDVGVPNPIDAVKSVGSKVVDAAKETGEFVARNKGTIAKVAVIGAVVACTAATAGICGGVAASTVAASIATSAAIGGGIRVAIGGDLLDPGAILTDVAFGAVPLPGAFTKIRHLGKAGHFQKLKAAKSALNQGTRKLFKPATDFLGKVSRRHMTFRPGPFAQEPIRATGDRVTRAQSREIQRIAARRGCHTCGTTNPGWRNWVADHQPVASRKRWWQRSQRLCPHCGRCSSQQGYYAPREVQ